MPPFALLLALAGQDHRVIGPLSGDEPATLPIAKPRCDRDSDAITVCANLDQARFRARPLPPQADHAFRPVVKLPGGGTAEAHAEQRHLMSGVEAPALMLSAHIPFGKGAKPKKLEESDTK